MQSLDDNVLAAAERGHQATDVYKAVSLLKQYGFEIGLQLMVGMPGQSFDSVKATVEQVLRLGPSFARIYPLLVIKGTPLEHIYESGEFEPLTLEAAVEQSAYVYSKLTLAGSKSFVLACRPMKSCAVKVILLLDRSTHLLVNLCKAFCSMPN